MTAPRSTRRDFLKGRAAADAVAAWADGALDVGEIAAPGGSGYLLEFSRQAMATTFQVIVNAKQHEQSPAAAIEALDLIDLVEQQLTVYRDTSELSVVNRTAHEGPTPVDEGLFQLLAQATSLHAATEGAFDITAGPLAKVWGFYRRQAAIPTEGDLATALACVGMQHVTLDAEAQTVHFLKSGVELNLGAIGKGYALDLAAALLESRGVADFIVHGGQSSVLAHGARRAESQGWPIGLGDPQRPGRRLALMHLSDRAVGTSGAAYQSFRHGGRRYGHVIDPRTGWPADGVLSATVAAPTAALADALSTAFYVLGEEGTERFFARGDLMGDNEVNLSIGASMGEIACAMVLPAQHAGAVRVRTWNFSDGEFEAVEEA